MLFSITTLHGLIDFAGDGQNCLRFEPHSSHMSKFRMVASGVLEFRFLGKSLEDFIFFRLGERVEHLTSMSRYQSHATHHF